MEENRRVRMTKRLLQDALLELLEEKSLEKITVTQVCSKSDVNRSTFYAYYQDVGELLSELEDGVLEKIPGAQKVPVARTDSEFIDTLERFFDYVKENRRLFTILLIRRDSGNFNHRLLDAVMEKHLKPTQQEPTRAGPLRLCLLHQRRYGDFERVAAGGIPVFFPRVWPNRPEDVRRGGGGADVKKDDSIVNNMPHNREQRHRGKRIFMRLKWPIPAFRIPNKEGYPPRKN